MYVCGCMCVGVCVWVYACGYVCAGGMCAGVCVGVYVYGDMCGVGGVCG